MRKIPPIFKSNKPSRMSKLTHMSWASNWSQRIRTRQAWQTKSFKMPCSKNHFTISKDKFTFWEFQKHVAGGPFCASITALFPIQEYFHNIPFPLQQMPCNICFASKICGNGNINIGILKPPCKTPFNVIKNLQAFQNKWNYVTDLKIVKSIHLNWTSNWSLSGAHPQASIAANQTI